MVGDHVFPFLRRLGGSGSSYALHLKDARLTIPTPDLLAKVVDMLDHAPMKDRDTKGDLYEYMLGKIAAAGQNGRFRTPRHIIKLMVAMTQPTPKDVICDPARRLPLERCHVGREAMTPGRAHQTCMPAQVCACAAENRCSAAPGARGPAPFNLTQAPYAAHLFEHTSSAAHVGSPQLGDGVTSASFPRQGGQFRLHQGGFERGKTHLFHARPG